jgi:hypothetical protein
MMNQLKMIKLVIMVEEFACVPKEVGFGLPMNFGQPRATQKWVSLLLTRYSGQP